MTSSPGVWKRSRKIGRHLGQFLGSVSSDGDVPAIRDLGTCLCVHTPDGNILPSLKSGREIVLSVIP